VASINFLTFLSHTNTTRHCKFLIGCCNLKGRLAPVMLCESQECFLTLLRRVKKAKPKQPNGCLLVPAQYANVEKFPTSIPVILREVRHPMESHGSLANQRYPFPRGSW